MLFQRPIKLNGHRLSIEKMDYDSEARHEGACLYTYTYNPLPDVNRDRRSSASPLHDFTLSSDDNGDYLSFFAEDTVDAYPSNMPSSNNDKTGGDQPSVDLTVSTEDNDELSFFSEDFLM